MSKAACATALMAVLSMSLGCGNNFRPVSTTLPIPGGNPSGAETDVVLNQCPVSGTCSNGKTGIASDSILTEIDVPGDFNAGNRQLLNQVGSVSAGTVGGVSIPTSPLALDASRTTVMTANTATDSVSIQLLGTITGGFASGTTTLTLPAGSAPIGLSFQFFGATYTQDYVVNSGANTVCPSSGSLSVISQPDGQLKATVCVGATPVKAWIYKDQSKVFVLDKTENQVYVVNASTYKVTNVIGVGNAPVKAAQDGTGQYLYILNSADGTISILDGQTEALVQTVPVADSAVCGTNTATPFLCNSPVIDMQQDTGVDDTNPNRNRLWLLHANGTVSVWNGTTPGQLSWITSVPTITTAQAAAVPAAYPTNLALLRDLTFAYVGIGNTNQMVAIDTSLLHSGEITPGAESSSTFPATTSIEVGINNDVPLQDSTTARVTSVAVSRGYTGSLTGSSSVLYKAYATTVTETTYYCYDSLGAAISCASQVVAGCTDNGDMTMTCNDLYNGTTVVAAATQLSTPINNVITTIEAPRQVLYCNPGTAYDGQKNCPAMRPVMALGRN